MGWGENIPDRGDSLCEDPGAGRSMVSSGQVGVGEKR